MFKTIARIIPHQQPHIWSFSVRSKLSNVQTIKNNWENASRLLSFSTTLQQKRFFFFTPPERKKAIELNREGVKLMHEKKYDEAQKKFDEALQLAPNTSVIIQNVAEVNRMQGKFAECIASYLQAAELSLSDKKWDDVCLIADELLAMGAFKDSFKLANIAIEENPSYYYGYLVLGKYYLIHSDVAKAKENLDKSLSLNSQKSETHELLGSIHFESDDLKQAEQYLHTAIKLNKDNYSAHALLSRFFFDTNQLDLAITASEEALDIMPRSYTARLYFARIIDEEGDPQKSQAAIEEFQQLIKYVYPQDAALRSCLGLSLVRNGQSKEGFLELDKALTFTTVRSGSAFPQMNYGLALYHEKRYSEASQSFQKAIQEENTLRLGERAALYVHYGMTLYKMNQLENALKQLRHAEDLSRSYEARVDVTSAMGKILMSMNKHEEAFEYLEKAVEQFDCVDGETVLCYFRSLLQLKREDQGIKFLKGRLKEEPFDPYWHNKLGELYSVTNKHEQAISSFQKALELDNTIPYHHANLGVALHNSNRTDEAKESFDKALNLARSVREKQDIQDVINFALISKVNSQ